MKNECRITSWNDLQDKLFEDSWNPEIGRFRSRFAFRGLCNVDYRLETTLIRLGGNFEEMENHLLRNFIKYAHRSVVEHDSIWNWLAVAQHHGLPTRILDWTYSPYVAMHFATADIDRFDIDGVIWAVNYIEAHKMLPSKLKMELKKEGANAFTVDMIFNAAGSFQEFSNLSPDKDFVIFIEPPSLDDRFINQYAFCSISSNPQLVLDDWLKNYPEIWKKIIIPKELKWEIRDKLDQANVTERVLFPGLDGLSQWLKRQYAPKE